MFLTGRKSTNEIQFTPENETERKFLDALKNVVLKGGVVAVENNDGDRIEMKFDGDDGAKR